MRVLKRFVQLSAAERRILSRVFLVVGVARASLWLSPLEKARRLVARAAIGAAGDSVEQVVWAVRAASRYLPGATCLTQALAVRALLDRHGTIVKAIVRGMRTVASLLPIRVGIQFGCV